jgi:hypothetical protein
LALRFRGGAFMDKFVAEMDAGRRSADRQRPEEFTQEVEAGRDAVARVQERLAEEQEAGRRAAAKFLP